MEKIGDDVLRSFAQGMHCPAHAKIAIATELLTFREAAPGVEAALKELLEYREANTRLHAEYGVKQIQLNKILGAALAAIEKIRNSRAMIIDSRTAQAIEDFDKVTSDGKTK